MKRKPVVLPNEQLIDLLEMICTCSQGGQVFIQAIQHGSELLDDPIRKELLYCVNENRLGLTFDESICNLANRLQNRFFHRAARLLLLGNSQGLDITPPLQRLISEIRSLSNKSPASKSKPLPKLTPMPSSLPPVLEER